MSPSISSEMLKGLVRLLKNWMGTPSLLTRNLEKFQPRDASPLEALRSLNRGWVLSPLSHSSLAVGGGGRFRWIDRKVYI